MEYIEGGVFCFKTVVDEKLNVEKACGWPAATSLP